MSKSLCGYCFKEYAPSCCEKSESANVKRQLAEARETNTELLIKLKAHKKQALSVAENIKFRELKEKGE